MRQNRFGGVCGEEREDTGSELHDCILGWFRRDQESQKLSRTEIRTRHQEAKMQPLRSPFTHSNTCRRIDEEDKEMQRGGGGDEGRGWRRGDK